MMIVAIILLQLIVAVVVLFVLKAVLERELWFLALERLEAFEVPAGESVREVNVLVGCALSGDRESRLAGLLKAKFPDVQSSIIISREIGGGVVVQINGKVLDCSLTGRLQHLWGHENP
jgi:F0F1-type ATP synthase delta subunit